MLAVRSPPPPPVENVIETDVRGALSESLGDGDIIVYVLRRFTTTEEVTLAGRRSFQRAARATACSRKRGPSVK